MKAWDRAYDRLVDTSGGDSVGARMRQERWAMLVESFPGIADMHVLDLGGTVDSWLQCPIRPAHVTLVNDGSTPGDVGTASPDWIDQREGDACALPADLRARPWDLVYSNSVLEHVGGHARRQDFAAAVHDLGPAHWVQTPNRYFPIEPHWLFPGFQFLPVGARTTVAMHWPLYKWRKDDREEALREVLDIDLIGRTELEHLFPRSEIRAERWMGLTKSLIAVRGSSER
jgi:hypothetical protein